MKKRIIIAATSFLIISLAVIAFVRYPFDSTIAATYTNGSITYGELRERAPKMNIKGELKKTLAETVCAEKIALALAKESSFANDESYQLQRERMIQPMITRAVIEQISKKIKPRWDYVRCRTISFLKNPDTKDPDEAKKRIEQTISLLKQGAKFDSLIKSYSNDPENAVAGNTVYIVNGFNDPVLEQTAFSLKDGEYNKEPILLQSGLPAVIIADKHGTLTIDNYKKIVSGRELERLTPLLEGSVHAQMISSLETSHSAKFMNIPFPASDTTVIFRLDGKEYTVKQLLARRNILSRIVSESLADPPILARIATEWYFGELYCAEAGSLGLLTDSDLSREISHTSDFLLANSYLRVLCEKEIKITETDIFNEYSKNRSHYIKLPDSSKKKPIQLSLQEARTFVIKNLIHQKIAVKSKEWKNNVIAQSKLIIL